MAISVNAQSKIEPQTLSSSGENLQNDNLSIDFTLGEFMVQTLGSDPRVTQGFQQADPEVIIKVLDPAFEKKIRIFPNPTMELLNIEFDDPNEFRLVISDLNGMPVLTKQFSLSTQVNLRNINSGTFSLSITSGDQLIYCALFEKTN